MESSILAEYEESPQAERISPGGGKWHADMMIGLVGAIANDSRSVYIANVPNRGSMPELPYEKIVEVGCD